MRQSRLTWLMGWLLLAVALLMPNYGGAWAATNVTTSKPAQGDGSSSNPFQISNAQELAWFRDWVNGTYTASGSETATTHPDACAKLTANIDMSTVCGASIGSWTPISDYEAYGSEWSNGWGGKFDGNNKTISNLYIDSRLIGTQTINKDKKCQGLFGKARASKYSYGEIKNIIFEKVSIYVEKSSDYTGTLAGETAYFNVSGIQVNSGSIQVSGDGGGIVGDLYNSNIYSSINKVNIVGVTSRNGGICGEIRGGEMKKCINYGNITNTNNYWTAGGLAGNTDTTNDFNFCNISDCANYGNVSAQYHVGGIVGFASTATIKNCISTGNITSLSDNEYYGMLIGSTGTGKVYIENTFYNTNATLTAGSSTKDIVSVGKKMYTPKEYSDASTGFTQQFLASGLIAYFLESKAETAGTWGQDISSSSKDAYPVLGGKKVYLDGPVSYNCQNTALNGTITNSKPAQEGTFSATPSHQIKLIAQVDAKCSEKGTKEHYQCEMCNKNFTDAQGEQEITNNDILSIPATGIHKPTEVKKVSPTCEAYGMEAHYLCSECNKMFADKECKYKKTEESLKIEILPHQYNDNDVCSMCNKAMPILEINTITPSLKKTDGVAEGKGGYNLWKYTATESKNLIITITKESDQDITNKVSIFDKDFNALTTSANLANGSTSINQLVNQGATYYIGITASNPTNTLSITLATVPQNLKGSGTAASPFELATANDMVWFKDYVNGKSGENLAHGDACAKLTANIDMSTVCGESIGSWEPINNWTGLFDGDGHTISNLYIKDAKEYTGLFGNVGSKEKQTIIRNIVFDNANITNTNANKSYNSIVVGNALNAKISDIHIESGALIANINIVDAYNWIYSGGIVGNGVKVSINSCTNKAVAKGFRCGGICGNIYHLNSWSYESEIHNCINYGNIEGNYAGGIASDAQLTTINNCANFGDITGNSETGGIAGWILSDTKIQNSFTTGNVSLCESHSQYSNIGLVVGNVSDSNLSNIAYSSEATLNGEANGKVIGYQNGGSSECTAYTQAQMKSGEVAYKLNGEKSEGNDLAWYQAIGTDDYPVLTKKEGGIVYYVQEYDCSKEQYTDTYEYLNVASKFIHNMMAEGETELDTDHHIYYTGCKRKACSEHHYYADPNATLEAEKQSDGSFLVEQLALTDGEAYDSQAEFTAQQLSYSRYFAHNKWQALYVPFETQVTEELLNDFELAAPNNLHEYELADGTTKVVLEAKLMKSGYTIKALRPYLIRAKEAGEKTIQLADCPLKAAADDSYVDCSSVLRHYKFIGTLKGKTSFDTTADLVLDGGLFLGAKADAQLKAMRWYINATDRDTDMGILPGGSTGGNAGNSDGDSGSTQASRSIDITIVDGDATTGIDDISVITEQASGFASASRRGIYDLQGRKLSQEPQSGVYIKDGKKVVK